MINYLTAAFLMAAFGANALWWLALGLVAFVDLGAAVLLGVLRGTIKATRL